MNQARQRASEQEEICEQNLSQETSFQLLKTLRELLNHLGLTWQGRMRYQVASPIQEQQNEISRGFNWGCPGDAEYETVRGILRQQKQLLQQELHEGKDASLRKLLLDLLRSLWRYLLFKSTGEEIDPLNSARCSRFYHEWRELKQLQQYDDSHRGDTFKQHLRMLISYLTDLTAGWRTDDSHATRYIEEINSPEISPEL